jgi:exodeoxyribonuclease VII small subunit
MSDQAETHPEPSFEQALSQLERIVASLEQGEPELTAALAKYQKGVVLLTQCHRLLDQAEQSVAVLTGVDDEGKPLTTPFDAAATIAREATTPVAASPPALANPPKRRKPSERSSTPKSPTPPWDDSSQTSDPPF